MAFAFSLPLSKAGIVLFSCLLVLFWVFEGNYRNKLKEIRTNLVLLSLAVFILFNYISILWSENLIYALDNIRMYLYFLPIFVIATKIKKNEVKSIINSFLSAMFLSEIIAYGVFFELWTFKHATVQNPSPFMFWIDYSVFMAFTSLILLNRVLSKSYSIKEKIFYLFFFITVTGNLFLAIGRTGQVALFGSIFILAILHYKTTFKSILIAISIISILIFSAYNLSDSFKNRLQAAQHDIEKLSNNNLNSSWGIRVAYWISTYDTAKNSFLLGVGIGDTQDETAKTIREQNYSFLNNESIVFMTNPKHHPHNQYLQIILQSGIIGLFLYIFFFYKLLSMKISNTEIKQLSILFSSVFLISCFANTLFYKHFTINLFTLFIGLFSVYYEKYRMCRSTEVN